MADLTVGPDQETVALAHPAMAEGGSRSLWRFAPAALLVASAALAVALAPEFYAPENLSNVARQAAPLALLALAQTVVLIGGGIDLSQAAVMQATTIAFAAWTGGRDDRIAVALPLVLLLGLGVGLVNGLLTTRGRLPAFIATLAVGITVTGLRLVLTDGTATGSVPPAVRTIGVGSVFGIPFATLIPAGVALVLWVVLRRTTGGRRLYATGSNAAATWAAGIRVERVLLVSYVGAGGLAAVAGLVLAGYIGFADQNIGAGAELDSIAAAVIGGASFAGGRGGVGGTLCGVLVLAVLLNLVLLLGLPSGVQLVAKAVVIVGGLASYRIARTKRVSEGGNT